MISRKFDWYWFTCKRAHHHLNASLFRLLEQKILTVMDDNYVVLSDDITLSLIRRDICDDPTKEVVLHYRILPVC